MAVLIRVKRETQKYLGSYLDNVRALSHGRVKTSHLLENDEAESSETISTGSEKPCNISRF